MSVTVSELNILLSSNIKPLEEGLKAGSAKLNKFARDAEKLVESVATPQEIYRSTINRAKDVLNKSDLEPKAVTETMARVREKAHKQMMRSIELQEMETDAYKQAEAAKRQAAIVERQVADEREEASKMLLRSRTALEVYLDAVERATYLSRVAKWTDEDRIKVLDNLQDQYEKAAAAERMAGEATQGYGKKGAMALGELARGAEDFLAVYSTTGFAGGMRAAANNLSQAAYVALGPLAGGVVGVGAALGTVLIPQIANYVTGAEDAAKATKKWADNLEYLRRVNLGTLVDEANELGQAFAIEDIGMLDTDDSITSKMQELERKTKENDNLISQAEKDIAAQAENLAQRLFGLSAKRDLDILTSYMDPELAAQFDKEFKDIVGSFVGSVVNTSDLDASLQVVEKKFKAFTQKLKSASSSDLAAIEALTRLDANSFLGLSQLTPLSTFFDPSVVDDIQALRDEEQETGDITKQRVDTDEKLRDLKREQREIAEQLKALEHQRNMIMEKDRHTRFLANMESMDELLTQKQLTEEERKYQEIRAMRQDMLQDAANMFTTDAEIKNLREKIDLYEMLVRKQYESARALEAAQRQQELDTNFSALFGDIQERANVMNLTDVQRDINDLIRERADLLQAAAAAGQAEVEAARELNEFMLEQRIIAAQTRIDELMRQDRQNEVNTAVGTTSGSTSAVLERDKALASAIQQTWDVDLERENNQALKDAVDLLRRLKELQERTRDQLELQVIGN